MICVLSFWLSWLSCQYLPSSWVERLLWERLTVARGSYPESPGRRVLHEFVGLVYCFIVLWYACVVFRPYMIYSIRLWHDIACLCWKCRYTPVSRLTSLFTETALDLCVCSTVDWLTCVSQATRSTRWLLPRCSASTWTPLPATRRRLPRTAFSTWRNSALNRRHSCRLTTWKYDRSTRNYGPLLLILII